MEHSQIILKILEDRKISAYRLAKETGISESLFSKWKKKSTSEISSKNLVLIADYLNCSVDYLIGRESTVCTTESASVLTNNEDTELLKLFHSLNDDRRKNLLEIAKGLLATQEDSNENLTDVG